MNKSVLAYVVMMVTDIGFFAIGAATFRYAQPLAEWRLQKIKDPAMRKTVGVFVGLLKGLALLLMLLSSFLFFRMCRIYGCVLKTLS